MSLRHAEMKAARALEHLDELKRVLQAYYDAEPCQITRYQRHDIGLRLLRIDFREVPERSYLLVGDFAHNLRSSLDYVVWSLVTKATGKTPKSTAIQFPIQAKEALDTFARQIEGVPQSVLGVIESLQPFHCVDPKDHPLWQLHKLDIIDKHHRIAMNENAFNVGSPDFSRRAGHRVYHGDNYVEFSFPIYGPVIPIHYNPKPDIQFGAGEDNLFVTPERLEEIYRFVVSDVIPRFAQFF
jgi:hypothetical protein